MMMMINDNDDSDDDNDKRTDISRDGNEPMSVFKYKCCARFHSVCYISMALQHLYNVQSCTCHVRRYTASFDL